jgi:HEAT repeat protein
MPGLSVILFRARLWRHLLGFHLYPIILENQIMTSSARDSTCEPIGTRRVTSLLAEFHSFEPGAREKAVLTLKALDRGAVIHELSGLLNTRNLELRCDAAEALLRIDSNQTIDLVLPLLTDPASTVRWNTCGLLHDFGDKRAIPLLVQVLLNDPEADVRLMAAYALGEIGDGSALSALRQASQLDDGADDEGYRVRDVATEAIESVLARER